MRLVREDLRWAFRRPYGWLLGIGVNLALSLAYLVVVPLRGGTHRDWAILVGTYFAVFVLADVTTTNVLGVDTERTRLRLMRGLSLARILLVKNLTLLVIVGLPTLVATAAITDPRRGELPPRADPAGRALPRADLARRRQPRLGPAALLAGAAGHPVARAPRLVADRALARLPRDAVRALRRGRPDVRAAPLPHPDPADLPPGPGIHGIELLVLGLLAWGVLTAVALVVAHRRGVPFDDLR